MDRNPNTRLYPTIEEALTLGTSKLAVDGVLIVGEHGTYEKNEKGQTLYPRYEFFQRVVEVFRSSGRAVPVFNDKHLSWNWDNATKMVDEARALGFAFMAGSSLPVTWRLPSVDMPWGAQVTHAMCVAYGGVDSYDFHALETIQCMVERRAGGETGVVSMETYRGDRFWQAHEQRVWPHDLFEAALARSEHLSTPERGQNAIWPTMQDVRKAVEDPIAYHYRHADGVECTMILLNGLVGDFNFAARLAGRDDPISTQFYLQMPSGNTSLASFFTPLVHHAERMFVTGEASYPIERTLLTTGLTAAAVDSLYEDQKRLDTPHLNVRYEVGPQSLFLRA